MNFFKSVFSGDPNPSDSSSEGKSPPESPHKLQEIEGGEEEPTSPSEGDSNLKSNTPWVGLGTLIKTFASKSESVIQTYRRDLEEFSSGLKKETEAIREVASRAVRDLPYSLEVGASAAQESLESVGQAIDDFGGSVWRGTAEIISEGKDVLLAADSDAEANSSDLQIPSSVGISASTSKRYSRFEAQVLAMQSDPNTFSEEPEDDEDFRKWMSEFKLEEKEEEIELLCYDNGILEGLFEKLVPSVVDYDTFWSRYFYKLYKLKQAEDVRANLVKRVISREDEDENLTWEVDDDEEEGKEEEREKDKNNEREMHAEVRAEVRAEDEAKVENKAVFFHKNDEEEGKEEEKEKDKNNERGMQAEMRAEDEAKVENKAESNNEHVEEEESKEKGEEDKEESKSEQVEESKDKGDTIGIESSHEKKPGGALDDTNSVENEVVASSAGEKDGATGFSNTVLPKASPEPVEPLKDRNISVVSSQNSMPEEEDLGWDEIEDLGEHDDRKVGGTSSTANRKDLQERLNVAEDDEDLTWDIEDDD